MNKALVVFLVLDLLLFVTVLHMANFASAIPTSTPPDASVLIETEARVNGGSGRIEREGSVYRFTGNVSNSVTVASRNIVIDGAGYTLRGNGEGYGLLVKEGNVTVKNLRIENFDIGIFANTYNITLAGNNIANNRIGIDLSSADDSRDCISGNYITNNEVGIFLGSNGSTFVAGNLISESRHGLELGGASKDSRIYHNSFINNINNIELNNVSGGVYRSSFGPVAWDDGVTGNYWSDYKSADSNNDGKGNLLYVIVSSDPKVAYCRDRLPLMAPAEVAVEAPTYAPLDTLQYGNNVTNPYAVYITCSIVAVQLVAIIFVVVTYRKKKAQRKAEEAEAAKSLL